MVASGKNYTQEGWRQIVADLLEQIKYEREKENEQRNTER
jgi:hypothetical protein